MSRRLYYAGRIAPRTCAPGRHIGPFTDAPAKFARWLGSEWVHCEACKSTITKPEGAAA